MKRLDHYVGVRPDGSVETWDVQPGDLYDHIVQFVGSPFDHAVIGGYEQDGKRLLVDVFLNDEGLFNGMEPNWPLLAVTGAPICGPVIFLGGVDNHGNSLRPWDSPILKIILDIAGMIKMGRDQIQHNREHPYTFVSLDDLFGERSSNEHSN